MKHDGKFASIPKDLSPYAITLDEAVALIVAKRAGEAKKVIKTFAEEPDLQVLNGRFGPYIAYAKSNYKIPKGKDAEALTLEECREIVANEANATKKRAPRRAARAKK